jgi:hypothetical protein
MQWVCQQVSRSMVWFVNGMPVSSPMGIILTSDIQPIHCCEIAYPRLLKSEHCSEESLICEFRHSRGVTAWLSSFKRIISLASLIAHVSPKVNTSSY